MVGGSHDRRVDKLRYEGGYRTAESIHRLYDRIDLQPTAQAYLDFTHYPPPRWGNSGTRDQPFQERLASQPPAGDFSSAPGDRDTPIVVRAGSDRAVGPQPSATGCSAGSLHHGGAALLRTSLAPPLTAGPTANLRHETTAERARDRCGAVPQ